MICTTDFTTTGETFYVLKKIPTLAHRTVIVEIPQPRNTLEYSQIRCPHCAWASKFD